MFCGEIRNKYLPTFDLGFTALSRIFHLRYADRSIKSEQKLQNLGKNHLTIRKQNLAFPRDPSKKAKFCLPMVRWFFPGFSSFLEVWKKKIALYSCRKQLPHADL